MTDPHPQRCIHYDACWFVHQHSRCPDDEPTEYEKSLPDCRFDTRTHTPAAATEPKPLRYSGVTVFTPPELSRHDAATRKAEREKMLEEICEPATDENKKDGWKLNVKWLVDIHRNIRNEGDNLCLEDIESVLLALKESLRGGAP